MISLPKEITYAELYFTLKCNLKCPYCINGYDNIKRTRTEKGYSELARYINNIDFGDISLTIGGGEPTIRSDFFDFLKSIKKEIKIDLLTNLQFDVDEFIAKTNPKRFTSGRGDAYKSIRASYHPSQMDAKEHVAKAKKLQDNGFSIGIFGIASPNGIGYNIQLAEIARKNSVYFFIKEFLGEYEGEILGFYRYKDAVHSKTTKTVECRSSELLIDGAGEIYKCHRDLYAEINSVGNICSDNPNIEYKYRKCSAYGNCNPCDVKNKIDRFLNRGRCSVEVKI